jgi:hypothetical protein
VRLWVAEIGEHSVTHIFRDDPSSLGDLLGAAAVICSDDLAHVLWVETRRERGRADEIAEHHGKLATFGGVSQGRSGGDGGVADTRDGRGAEGGNGLEQPLAVPERQAELFKVALTQLRQHFAVDRVLAEHRLVLVEAELP